MTAPAWYNDGKKLIEGETYVFHFIKIVPLSDKMNYMLMEDPYGIRHLVPFEYYIHYKLVPGSKINCLVDKINCTGRVFLEPEHPRYKIGSVSGFNLLGTKQDKDYSVLVVADIFGNEIQVEIPDGHKVEPVNGSVYCKIEGFKKGKPILSFDLPAAEYNL
ncbi:MAG: hypothetical protein V1775_05265 [Bacteroidota bacterium]